MTNAAECPTLSCSVTLEWLNSQNCVVRKSALKNVILRLIRNEFREIFLEILTEKGTSVNNRFQLKGITVHKKFMAEGKASINFQLQKLILLISNAPPVNLLTFLKTVFIKLSADTASTKVPIKSRLLSAKDKIMQEISPVTLQEVNKAKAKVSLPNTVTTPPTGKKRPLQTMQVMGTKKIRIASGLDPCPLTDEQKQVLEAALKGQNIFFTGSAGTGKSYLLQRILGALPPDVTVATASTGVAACQIGGVTLHSFAGIGSGQASKERCIELATRPQVQQMWRKCRHLIIDEISMVEGEFFEKLDYVARIVRNNERPFGGIQLILCGDFLQLPPVCRDAKPGQAKICFQSAVWDQVIHTSFELNKVHRQADPEFIKILQNVRIGRITPEISDKLISTSKHKIEVEGILATRLCSHMQDADLINRTKMGELPGMPAIRFSSRKEYVIRPDRWVVKAAGGTILTRKQLPLRLAWAFSIHKSQGLSLDCVEMSLSRVFEAGQAYVALSRAKNFDTLRVLDFDPKQVWANPEVLAFYRKFRRTLHAMEIVPLGKKARKHY
ncbi:ATP-dependent DNA helicase PIF1-like [Schistocerca piceifrons]|uniref:ATP-dependent DNA helicase PIF1-like n=1 Tax=Schistocerca piceifrons TaxID=274613 RepID=UPI001F5E84F6|nr:ATP-dependent DNA helicase PIF1-like [Schistocerca piceifrons]XP_047105013.1 ATP-dependent DNA helicase PIF1-like [Schistocerca piceifrons]XP_047105014.1 ATP-dependent DNA helicase PIF1-like [Schistocerca piceifrons]